MPRVPFLAIAAENRLILLGLGLSLLFWVADSAVDAMLFGEGALREQLWTPSGREVGMRSFVVVLFIVFGVCARSIVAGHGRAEARLRASEERYRMLVDTMNDGLGVQDGDGVITFVNDRLCEIFGYPREEMLGCRVTDFVDERNQRIFKEQMHRRQKGESGAYEITWTRKDAQTAHTLISPRSTFDADGKFSGSFAVITDITKQQQAEARIQQLNSELAHASRVSLMGEMLAAMAHEFHQPLAVIGNYANGCTRRLQQGKLDSGQLIEKLQDINAEVLRAGKIIRGISDLARKKGAKSQLVDINAAIEDTMRLAKIALRARDVDVELALAENLAMVFADRVLLMQVILNLVTNGMEAMTDTDQSKRKLTVETMARGEDVLEVAVRDSGPGIPVETQEKLFEPFFTTKKEGMGMGLAISRSISESHGGRLWCTSEPGKGSVFRFTIPVATYTEMATAEPAAG